MSTRRGGLNASRGGSRWESSATRDLDDAIISHLQQDFQDPDQNNKTPKNHDNSVHSVNGHHDRASGSKSHRQPAKKQIKSSNTTEETPETQPFDHSSTRSSKQSSSHSSHHTPSDSHDHHKNHHRHNNIPNNFDFSFLKAPDADHLCTICSEPMRLFAASQCRHTSDICGECLLKIRLFAKSPPLPNASKTSDVNDYSVVYTDAYLKVLEGKTKDETTPKHVSDSCLDIDIQSQCLSRHVKCLMCHTPIDILLLSSTPLPQEIYTLLRLITQMGQPSLSAMSKQLLETNILKFTQENQPVLEPYRLSFVYNPRYDVFSLAADELLTKSIDNICTISCRMCIDQKHDSQTDYLTGHAPFTMPSGLLTVTYQSTPVIQPTTRSLESVSVSITTSRSKSNKKSNRENTPEDGEKSSSSSPPSSVRLDILRSHHKSFTTLRMLSKHLIDKHHLSICNACQSHSSDFLYHRAIFSRADLMQHGQDEAHNICKLCLRQCYDEDELYAHIVDPQSHHYLCDLCTSTSHPYADELGNQRQDEKHVIFGSIGNFVRHLYATHYICTHPQCSEFDPTQFNMTSSPSNPNASDPLDAVNWRNITAFSTMTELTRHQSTMHSAKRKGKVVMSLDDFHNPQNFQTTSGLSVGSTRRGADGKGKELAFGAFAWTRKVLLTTATDHLTMIDSHTQQKEAQAAAAAAAAATAAKVMVSPPTHSPLEVVADSRAAPLVVQSRENDFPVLGSGPVRKQNNDSAQAFPALNHHQNASSLTTAEALDQAHSRAQSQLKSIRKQNQQTSFSTVATPPPQPTTTTTTRSSSQPQRTNHLSQFFNNSAPTPFYPRTAGAVQDLPVFSSEEIDAYQPKQASKASFSAASSLALRLGRQNEANIPVVQRLTGNSDIDFPAIGLAAKSKTNQTSQQPPKSQQKKQSSQTISPASPWAPVTQQQSPGFVASNQQKNEKSSSKAKASSNTTATPKGQIDEETLARIQDCLSVKGPELVSILANITIVKGEEYSTYSALLSNDEEQSTPASILLNEILSTLAAPRYGIILPPMRILQLIRFVIDQILKPLIEARHYKMLQITLQRLSIILQACLHDDVVPDNMHEDLVCLRALPTAIVTQKMIKSIRTYATGFGSNVPNVSKLPGLEALPCATPISFVKDLIPILTKPASAEQAKLIAFLEKNANQSARVLLLCYFYCFFVYCLLRPQSVRAMIFDAARTRDVQHSSQ